MTLTFPNQSRRLVDAKDRIHFVGHDDVFQISFQIELHALFKMDQTMNRSEQGSFAVFDAARDAIEGFAQKAYGRKKGSMIVLTAGDVGR